MILQLKANHFKGIGFSNNENCPITKAFKDQTGLNCNEGVTHLTVDGTYQKFSHQPYCYENYIKDKTTAKINNYSSKVIRELILTNEI